MGHQQMALSSMYFNRYAPLRRKGKFTLVVVVRNGLDWSLWPSWILIMEVSRRHPNIMQKFGLSRNRSTSSQQCWYFYTASNGNKFEWVYQLNALKPILIYSKCFEIKIKWMMIIFSLFSKLSYINHGQLCTCSMRKRSYERDSSVRTWTLR